MNRPRRITSEMLQPAEAAIPFQAARKLAQRLLYELGIALTPSQMEYFLDQFDADAAEAVGPRDAAVDDARAELEMLLDGKTEAQWAHDFAVELESAESVEDRVHVKAEQAAFARDLTRLHKKIESAEAKVAAWKADCRAFLLRWINARLREHT